MYRTIGVVFLGCLLAGEMRSGEKTVKGWGQIADPEGDCKFAEKDGKLTLSVPGNRHDFDPRPGYKNNGPRAFQEVEGDFAIEVRISGTIVPDKGKELDGKDYAFRAGTLLVWQDSNNFIRLDRTGMVRGDNNITAAYFHVFKDGKRIFEQAPLIKDEVTILRIERKGNLIMASYIQGKTKKTFPNQESSLDAKVQVGVGAVNASSQPLEVVFDELKLTKGKGEK